MPMPMTRMPGTTGPTAPLDAMMAVSGRTPMFGADQGPRYTGPFNLNMGGNTGMMLQLAMPMLLQGFMNGRMPAQFLPEQNLYDQMVANQHYQASFEAMKMASQQDTGTITSMIGGATQLMTGAPLTDKQTAQNRRMAEGVSQLMPYLTQFLGPDLVDRLHGSRGSATVFAQQFHQAMRTARDPVSGFAGYSGESAGTVTQEVFDNLFGPNADVQLNGLSMGQAGMAIEELQARGLMGRPMGTMSAQEQRAELPQQLTDEIVTRLAERLPQIRDIRAAGNIPTEQQLDDARTTIRGSHAALIDPNREFTKEQISEMPGGDDLIRSTDATRISQRLENMSGAIKAMRDIFGDMGNPNAPMREIINGLDALTQGGLATMSPGDLERMVRRTHTIAKQTGLGVQGVMALASQNAPLADQLGLDRSYAMRAAQQSALFGSAASDQLRLDMPTWGAMSQEQLTLADTQLRMHAAASPLANQLNAIVRMADTGMAKPKAGSELEAMTAAIKAGETSYEFAGKRRDVVMSRAQLLTMLERDAGVNASEAMAVIKDRFGNQEYGQPYNLENTVRQVMSREAVRRLVAPVLSGTFRGALEQSETKDVLIQRGVMKDDADFRVAMDEVSRGVGDDFLAMDPETLRTPEARRKALGQAFHERLRQSIKRRMPDATDAQVNAATAAAVQQMGGQDALDSLGEASYARINSVAGGTPFRTAVGLHDLSSQDAMKSAAERSRQADTDAAYQEAMSGLGTADPIQRAADALQQAGPETTLQDMFGRIMGGVDQQAIDAADPQGTVAQIMGLAKRGRQLDPNDPAQFQELMRNADILKALVNGGGLAEQQLRKMEEGRAADGTFSYGNEQLYKQLQQAADGKSGKQILYKLSGQAIKAKAEAQKTATGGPSPIEQDAMDRVTQDSGQQGGFGWYDDLLKPLFGTGLKDLNPADMATEAMQQLRQFRDPQQPVETKDDQDREMKVSLSGGNITLREDNTVDMVLEGQGYLNRIDSTLGMA